MSAPTSAPIAAVIGVAGHVDHGKTSLVRALTGIDTDRLPEEKARGISIELGFAWLDLPAGRVAIVDVPGHERFVRQMVAGAAGIDLVVLVVAADEGVMPQTREHLDICQLLGVERGLVALTRTDLAEPDLLELVHDDVAQATAGTFLAGQPIVPFSIHDPGAPARLAAALDHAVAGLTRADERDRPFVLAIDRAFSRPGFGTVVTGTTRAGIVAVGDELALHHPSLSPRSARVRGLEVHGQPVERAGPGQRVALNLAGVGHELPRGTRLTHPGPAAPAPAALWDVRLSARRDLALALPDGEKGLACFGASVVESAIAFFDRDALAPGESAFAQLRLAEPLALLPGERWVLRGFRDDAAIGATLGGGVVIAPAARRRKRLHAAASQAILGALSGRDPRAAVSALVAEHGERGLSWRRLHASLPFARAVIDAAVTASGLIATAHTPDPLLIAPAALGPLEAALERVLGERHRAMPAGPGLTLDELRTRTRPDSEAAVFAAIVDHLVAAGRLRRLDQGLALPGFTPSITAADSALDGALLAALEACELMPPRVEELGALLGSAPAQAAIDAAVTRLCTSGVAARVQKDMVFAVAALERFEARVRAHFAAHPWLDAQGLKELTGATRKWSIPLGEWLDRARVTVRVGDRRRLRA